MRQPSYRAWALAGLLIGALFVAYFPIRQAGFIWDDDFHLTENPCIVGPLGFADIWTSPSAYYYPGVLTSFWLQHAWWGLAPLPFHLVTIAVHALAALVLWRVLLRLGLPAPWFVAAAWALHPVQVESVAWITELKNTQSALGFFLAIWAWLKHVDAPPGSSRQRELYYILALLFTCGAYASKTSTVMLPVILVWITWWLGGSVSWRTGVRLLPVFALSAAAAGWTIWEQRVHSGASGVEWNQTLVQRVLIASRAIWFYAGKLFWPHPLMFIYPRAVPDGAQAGSYWPLGAIVLLAFALWRFRRRARPILFAGACFITLLFPVLGFFNVYFFRYSFVADHFQYLASVAPIAASVAGAVWLASRLPPAVQRWLRPVVGTACLGALGLLTWRQTHVYLSNDTLWRDALAKNPRCWLAHINLGKAEAKAGRTDEAISEYRAALAIYPDYAGLQNLLGNTLQEERRFDEAAAAYRAALRADPNFADAHANLGALLVREHRTGEAITHFEKALAVNPQSIEAENGMGNALMVRGDATQAIECFRHALRLAPDFVAARFNLANSLVATGQTAEAIRQYQRALTLDPKAADIHTNLGAVLYRQHRWQEATYHLRQALAVAPSAEAHTNLGNALRESGRFAEALAHYARARDLDPRYARAYLNAAWILATCPDPAVRDGAKAVALAQQLAGLTGDDDPGTCRVLAAAYAEAGRFPDAVARVRQALQLPALGHGGPLRDSLKAELQLYEAGAPSRQYQAGIIGRAGRAGDRSDLR